MSGTKYARTQTCGRTERLMAANQLAEVCNACLHPRGNAINYYFSLTRFEEKTAFSEADSKQHAASAQTVRGVHWQARGCFVVGQSRIYTHVRSCADQVFFYKYYNYCVFEVRALTFALAFSA